MSSSGMSGLTWRRLALIHRLIFFPFRFVDAAAFAADSLSAQNFSRLTILWVLSRCAACCSSGTDGQCRKTASRRYVDAAHALCVQARLFHMHWRCASGLLQLTHVAPCRPHLHIQELKHLRPVAVGSRSSHPPAQPPLPSSERAGPVSWDHPVIPNHLNPYHPAQPALERSGPVARAQISRSPRISRGWGGPRSS